MCLEYLWNILKEAGGFWDENEGWGWDFWCLLNYIPHACISYSKLCHKTVFPYIAMILIIDNS